MAAVAVFPRAASTTVWAWVDAAGRQGRRSCGSPLSLGGCERRLSRRSESGSRGSPASPNRFAPLQGLDEAMTALRPTVPAVSKKASPKKSPGKSYYEVAATAGVGLGHASPRSGGAKIAATAGGLHVSPRGGKGVNASPAAGVAALVDGDAASPVFASRTGARRGGTGALDGSTVQKGGDASSAAGVAALVDGDDVSPVLASRTVSRRGGTGALDGRTVQRADQKGGDPSPAAGVVALVDEDDAAASPVLASRAGARRGGTFGLDGSTTMGPAESGRGVASAATSSSSVVAAAGGGRGHAPPAASVSGGGGGGGRGGGRSGGRGRGHGGAGDGGGAAAGAAVVEPAGRPEMAAARATSLPLSSCQDHCPNLNAQAASNQLLLTSAAA